LRIGSETIDLSTEMQVISSEELKKAWTQSNGSTLIFYINPIIKDRTAVSGSEYASVIQIGSKQKFNILVAPDAGRGYISSPAQLIVSVEGSTTPNTIDIPNFPLQKWTAVAIVKQGRKFNIYLNGKLKVSHMCTAMPDFDSTQPLKVGDRRLEGQIALMSIAPYPMQSAEVKSIVQATVGTDGKPYLSSGVFSFIPIPSINLSFNPFCPGGNCNSTASQISPLQQWSSQYS